MLQASVFKEAVSEKRLLNVVKEVSCHHRIQASPMYREAAKHMLDICKNYGLEAKILSYEADPSVWYLQSKMFKEWSIEKATLELVDPAVCLADFSAEPISVIQKSAPIDRREDPVDLLMLEKDATRESCEGLDLKGKFVFIRGHIRRYDWVFDEGALGIVTDFIMETKNRKRSDLYESLTYTSFWPGHTEGEKEKCGFVLSPKTGDMLEKLCREKQEKDGSYLKVKPYIDSSFYNGHIEIVEVRIKGKDDKTVYLSAHLCHPKSSCNDNASGVSAGIEAMNVIHKLIEEGKIDKPEHSIVLTLIPEFTGTFAYLSDHNDYKNGLGAMNLDMVGGRQTRFYGPITLTKTPYELPALNNELCMIAMDKASKEAYSLSDDPVALTNHRVEPHSGGSDHTVYCDPSIGIPCCMLGQWPDLNYHTATDTLDVIDPAVLKFSCLTAANFAYDLATLKKEDLPYLFAKQEEVLFEDKNRYALEYLDGKIGKPMFGSLMFCLKDYYLNCLDAACRLVEDCDVRKQKEHVAKIFDEWIAFYDLKDDYPVEDDLNVIYRRKFIGPVHQVSDYRALGFGEALDEYQEKTKKDPFAMFGVQDLVTNLIDGKRSLGQIVRIASLIKRKDVKEATLILIGLYEKLGLIEKT